MPFRRITMPVFRFREPRTVPPRSLSELAQEQPSHRIMLSTLEGYSNGDPFTPQSIRDDLRRTHLNTTELREAYRYMETGFLNTIRAGHPVACVEFLRAMNYVTQEMTDPREWSVDRPESSLFQNLQRLQRELLLAAMSRNPNHLERAILTAQREVIQEYNPTIFTARNADRLPRVAVNGSSLSPQQYILSMRADASMDIVIDPNTFAYRRAGNTEENCRTCLASESYERPSANPNREDSERQKLFETLNKGIATLDPSVPLVIYITDGWRMGTPGGLASSEKSIEMPFFAYANNEQLQRLLAPPIAPLQSSQEKEPAQNIQLSTHHLRTCAQSFVSGTKTSKKDQEIVANYLLCNGLIRIRIDDAQLRYQVKEIINQ
jgi:hypothetical protein